MVCRFYIAIIAAISICQIASAQEKPLVKVVFEIREAEHNDFFGKDTIEIEKTISDSIASIFNDKIP